MNLNYILGESRSGKSRWIYNQIKKDLSNKDRNLILIVPEQITYEKERELIDFLEVNGIMKVQILSFTRLEYKVLEEVGGIKEKEIDDYGKIMLLREIFEKNKKDLKVFGRSYKKEGFLKNFNGLIKEFKENGLQLNVLEKIKSEDDHYAFDRKLNDIKIIYKNLEEKLEHTYLDNEDKKLLFIRKIKDSNYIKNSYIYIDEFNKFSKLQIKMIRELLETSQNMFITLPVEDEEGLEREEFKISVDTLNYLNNEVENLNPTINYQYLKRENILKDDINHLERNFFSYFPDKHQKNPENIEVFYGQNPYEEVEMVADRIIKDLKNYNIRFRNIGILLGDEAVYLPVIEKVFKEYDIPFFSDYKKDLMDNSFIIFLMSYLDCITYNYKREDVFRLLKIGYWDLDYEEIEDLENYCIRWGIDRNRWFSEFNKEDEYSNLDYLNEIRKKVISIIPSKDSFNKEDTIENFVLKIIKEIEKLKLKEKIQKDTERFREEKLYEAAYINNQVWNSVMDLFDQIITISGGSKIKINELKNIIESGLLEYEVGVLPTKLDSITVGNLERTKFGSKSSLYLVGVNDGYIPKTYEDNGILVDEEKDILKKKGLELKNSDYMVDSEKHNFYNVLSRGKEKIYFSYSLGDYDGSSLVRSSYIDKIKEIFPNLEIISSINTLEDDKIHGRKKPALNQIINKITKDENIENLDKIYKEGLKWFLINYDNFENYLGEGFLYTNNKEYIEEDYIDKLYDNPLNLSPYRLESFAQCPFKFFVEYGLAPEERREYEVDSRDIGKIYHRSMEKFTKEIINNKEDFLELDKGIQIMEKSLDEALEEENVNNSPIDYNHRNKYIKKKIKRVGIETAKGIVEQLNRSDFKPKYQEISFSEESVLKPIEMILKDDRILKINGRIDRVDILSFNNNNYVNIIDYKSKDQSIDITALANGMELQLFIYLNALIDNSEEITGKPSDIGGVFYFSILLPWIDGDKHKDKDSIEKELLKEYKMEGYFLEDKELIKKLDKKIEEERESTVAKIKINKNGSISKSSQTLTREAYKGLLKYVNDKVLEIGKEIISGKILIEPFKRNQNIPCKWCSYIDICQFDKTMPDNKYKIIKKVDKKNFENILEKIGEEHDKLD